MPECRCQAASVFVLPTFRRVCRARAGPSTPPGVSTSGGVAAEPRGRAARLSLATPVNFAGVTATVTDEQKSCNLLVINHLQMAIMAISPVYYG
jgi:hypothetical protein